MHPTGEPPNLDGQSIEASTPGVSDAEPASVECPAVVDRSDVDRPVAGATGGHDPQGHWFEELAAHMGEAYLRYSFTKGTDREIDFLTAALGLGASSTVLDVGCGPGRHVRALAQRGIAAHGVDISTDFIDIARRDAPTGATFERADARNLQFDGCFDAVICLCQGAFGVMLNQADDEAVLDGIARATRPNGRLALTAFHSYFVVKHFDDTEFDPVTGLSHERTEVRDGDGRTRSVDLWTGCYTARELRLLLEGTGWRIDHIYGVEPGNYGAEAPSVDFPELLVLATKAS